LPKDKNENEGLLEYQKVIGGLVRARTNGRFAEGTLVCCHNLLPLPEAASRTKHDPQVCVCERTTCSEYASRKGRHLNCKWILVEYLDIWKSRVLERKYQTFISSCLSVEEETESSAMQ